MITLAGTTGKRACDTTHLGDQPLPNICQCEHAASGHVLADQTKQRRRRRLASLHEPELDELRKHSRRLRRADVREAGDGSKVQLRSRLREHSEDSPLGARDDCLDRFGEVHTASLSLRNETIVSFMSCTSTSMS